MAEVAEKMTPERKAAAVIVSLGVDKASQIYKYLGQEDLERLTVEVAKLGHLKAEETEGILDEFYKECLTQKVVADGGIEYARQVLEKAFGEETASMLLQKVLQYRGIPRYEQSLQTQDTYLSTQSSRH